MKYSYITLLSTENYLNGVLCLNASLKKVKAKYPLTVVVTENIRKDIQDMLENKEIKVIHIKKMPISKKISEKNDKGIFSHWNNTFDKLQIFELIDYDKLVYLDSDMLVRKNIDDLFEKDNLSAVIDRKEPNVMSEWIKLTSGTLVIEPQKGYIEKFIDIMSDIVDKRNSVGDQDVLQEYDKKWNEKENLHLDVKYNTFFIYLDYYIKSGRYKLEDISVVHFILKWKPWNLTLNNYKEYLKFLENRLIYNYQVTKKEVFKECLDIGNENKKKVILEYIKILNSIKNEI